MVWFRTHPRARASAPESTRTGIPRGVLRTGSVVLGAVLVGAGVVPAVAAPLPAPIASYDFSAVTGTQVPDASGNGRDATIKGTGATVAGDELSLPGGAAGSGAAYVELPRGLFDRRDTVSISLWLKNDTSAGNQAAMFFGTTEALPSQYWLLNPANPAGQVKSVLTNGLSASSPWTTESGFSPSNGSRGIPGPAATSDWALYTAVITPTSITAYLDDAKIGTVPTTRTVSQFGDDLVSYIGRSSYNDRFWAGGVRDVAVYDTALSDADVAAIHTAGLPSEQEDVDADAAALAIPNADDIRGNITLPTNGASGSTIQWTSSVPGTVGTDGDVTRPASGQAPVTVTLTAQLAKGSSTGNRVFTVTVQPLPATADYEGYFFPFFTGESSTTDEEISFAASRGDDPKSWVTLNDGKPVLTSTRGEQGIRDPFILRSPDGDRFYMIATDLNMFDIYRGDFGQAQESGSRKLNVWESDDLVNWSAQRQITVSSELAGNTWAPEATWDEESGQYIVYWASNLYPDANVASRDVATSYNRMMAVTTRDFVTFSEPTPWIDVKRGNGRGMIDATIVKDGDTYYRFIKDEASMTVRQEKSTDLDAVVTGSLPTTTSTPGWQLVKERIGVGQPNPWGGTFTEGEGPSAFRDNTDPDHWYLLIDQPSYHGGQGYMLFETDDIASGDWTSVTDARLPGRARHGTVLPITKAEQERLLAAYPTDTDSGYTITVDPTKTGPEIDENMYGIFFEDINWAADGGLYAELVRNRSFEFLPIDRQGYNGMTSWTPVAGGTGGAGSTRTVNDASRLNERNRTYLEVTLANAAGGTYGVENDGFNGVAVTSGAKYDFSVFARTTSASGTPLTAVIRAADGTVLSDTVTATVAGDGWTKYTGTLTATRTSNSARLLVEAGGQGTLRVDEVSLFPQDTFKGRPNGLRKDLAQKIADLKPKFVRFPGGCIVNVNSHADYSAASGYERARSYQWKDSVGPVETRATNSNFWGYNQTLGLGYFEYFQFAEDIGAIPVPDVPALINGCGQGLSPTNNPAQLQRHIQDSLDLIEFARGDASTTWGKLRADMGHPEPFFLDRLEVGNEENFPEAFMANFVKFRDAIKAKYPDITVISNSGPDDEGPSFEKHWQQNRAENVEMVDEHYYNSPAWFLENNARYDSYDRNGPDVWIGEYASQDNRLFNGLAEAAYMTGLERNADVVKMASYAPLLANVDNTQWFPDMIWFDNDQSWGSANYEVQKLFMNNVGDRVIPTAAGGDTAKVAPITGSVGLSTWSTAARYDDVRVTTPEGTELFADDFDDRNADGWSTLAPGGQWSAADGSYTQSSTTANNTLVAGPALTATDYDVSLKATKLGGAEGFLLGFGVKDSGNYYWWNLGGFGNTRSLVEKAVNGGKSTIASTGTPTIQTNRTYDVDIQVRGTKVTLLLDGQVQATFTDSKVAEPFAQVLTQEDATGDLILKVVNAQAKEATTTVDLAGTRVEPTAEMTVISGSPDATNTRDATPVQPRASTITGVDTTFTRTFAPYSITFIRMHTRAPDTQKPVVTVTSSPTSPDGANGWYTSPVSVTATATDDSAAAPAIEVSLDGGTTWAPYTSAVSPQDGERTLAFRAKDAAGNVSDVVTVPVKLDREGPTVAGVVDTAARTVTVTATDATSGVEKIQYLLGTDAPTARVAVSALAAPTWTDVAGSQAVITVPEGETQVTYRAVDNAGNVGASAVTTLGAQAGDPSLTVTGDLVAGGWITVTGAGWPADTAGVLELAPGAISLGAVSTDGAGAFQQRVQLPADLRPGTYTVLARIGGVEAGVTVQVRQAGASGPGTVPPSAGGTGGPLAVTGTTVTWSAAIVALLAMALGGYLVVRRRRATHPQD